MQNASRTNTPKQRIEDNCIVAPNGCWVWFGAKNDSGYGVMNVNGKRERAHRVAYEAFVGPIPKGLVIDHLCREKRCVNWRHLDPVTSSVNVKRFTNSIAKLDQRAQCKNGHPINGAESVSYRKWGNFNVQYCRECVRITNRRAHAKWRGKRRAR
jgi:hypothetical protein